jgi:hypothetical protein
MKEIEQKRLLVLRTKEEELKKKKLKTLQRKENMTNDILCPHNFYHWQMCEKHTFQLTMTYLSEPILL